MSSRTAARAAETLALATTRLAASRQRLSMNHPFFASLLLMSDVRLSDSPPTACTDGMRILVNPAFACSLSREQLDGLLVHEVLHCALLHVPRRGMRDALLWNIAADIQVNGKVRRCRTLDLPAGSVINPKLEQLSVEDIYDILQSRKPADRPNPKLGLMDLKDSVSGGGDASDPGDSRQAPSHGPDRQSADGLAGHWRNAMALAQQRARAMGMGSDPSNLLLSPDDALVEVNWRHQLWRYVIRTPDDFVGFDRRLLARRMYIETLDCESLDLDVCIDTSGSVNEDLLGLFIAELGNILSSHHFMRCRLRWADAAVSEPFDLRPGMTLPPPTGGGGTDFRPFFDAIEGDSHRHSMGHPVAIYFTDGFGIFPACPPGRHRVLWVVPPQGAESSAFPFGDVIRLG